jgi:hypothetical protein
MFTLFHFNGYFTYPESMLFEKDDSIRLGVIIGVVSG